MFKVIQWLNKKIEKHAQIEYGRDSDYYDVGVSRPQYWRPKVFILQKPIPGILIGARFTQAYTSDNVYFYAIPISGCIEEKHQVGIMQFEAQYVENNEEWFISEKEDRIRKDPLNDSEKFFYN